MRRGGFRIDLAPVSAPSGGLDFWVHLAASAPINLVLVNRAGATWPSALWRREGLKVPKKQPKRGRLWLNDGSCVRLRPERTDHIWAYDLVSCRTEDDRAVRLLTVINQYTTECVAIGAAWRIRSDDVMHTPTGLFTLRGVPEHLS